MTTYVYLTPELLLLIGAAWALFAERLPGGDRGSAWAGAACSLAAAVVAGLVPATSGGPFPVLTFDGPARFARVAVAALTVVWLLWTAGRGRGRLREAVALALFSAMGAMFMAEARELITLMLALELATMPAYVLIGYRRGDLRGLEGALKYFLLSMLTTLVMLYGFSFLYGLSGTTRFAGLHLGAAGTLGMVAVILSLVGLFAKLSAVPFHFWAPDAYEGARPWAVAFVSTVPKVAGAVAIVRLVTAIAPGVAVTAPLIVIVSAASMLLGNLGALTQTDVRRMMGYSGVAHTGYLLMGVGALSLRGTMAAVLYAVAYAIPTMGIMLVTAEAGPTLADFGGLFAKRPATAWGVTALLLSLVGIPPLVGFFGKLSLFAASLQRGYWWLVLIAVLMSVVSAGYYLRIVRSMFFAEEPVGHVDVARNTWGSLALATCVFAVFALGLAAGPVLGVIGQLR